LLFCLAIFIVRIISMSIVDSQRGDDLSKIYQLALYINPISSATSGQQIFDFGYPDVLDIVVILFTVDRILGGVTAVLVFSKFLKFFGGKGNERRFVHSVVYDTLSNCKAQLGSLFVLYLVMLFSFSLAAHVAFGSRVQRIDSSFSSSSNAVDRFAAFRTISSSFFAMFLQSLQLIGGGIFGATASGVATGLFSGDSSASSSSSIDSFAWIFFVVFTVCINFVLVNCFVAVIYSAFSTTVRSTRHDQGLLPLSETLKNIFWTTFLYPIVSSLSRQHASAAKKYFSLRADGKSYQKLLVVLLKYVRERSEFIEKRRREHRAERSGLFSGDDKSKRYQVDDDETTRKKNQNRLILKGGKNNNNNEDDEQNGQEGVDDDFLSAFTTPFEMLDWLPEELVLALVPSSVSSISHYKFGGASTNESFEEENTLSSVATPGDDDEEEENHGNRRKSKKGFNPVQNKNILKMNISEWERAFPTIPQDDYYMLLWKSWNDDLNCQNESYKKKELFRLKKNVFQKCVQEFDS
jgi:hypothetical protein